MAEGDDGLRPARDGVDKSNCNGGLEERRTITRSAGPLSCDCFPGCWGVHSERWFRATIPAEMLGTDHRGRDRGSAVAYSTVKALNVEYGTYVYANGEMRFLYEVDARRFAKALDVGVIEPPPVVIDPPPEDIEGVARPGETARQYHARLWGGLDAAERAVKKRKLLDRLDDPYSDRLDVVRDVVRELLLMI